MTAIQRTTVAFAPLEATAADRFLLHLLRTQFVIEVYDLQTGDFITTASVAAIDGAWIRLDMFPLAGAIARPTVVQAVEWGSLCINRLSRTEFVVIRRTRHAPTLEPAPRCEDTD
jgi:hypothetical protein